VFLADCESGFKLYRECSSIFSDSFESGDTSAWSSVLP
jgi:hypothetical protein